MEISHSAEGQRQRFIDLARQYFGPNIYEVRHPSGGRVHYRLCIAEYIRGGLFKEDVERQILTLMVANGDLFVNGEVFQDMDLYVFCSEHFDKAVQFAQACEQITKKRVRLLKNWRE